MSKRGYRRAQREAVISRRMRLLKQLDRTYHAVLEPGMLAKRAPLDCGQAHCYWCHNEKYSGIKPARYRRKYAEFL